MAGVTSSRESVFTPVVLDVGSTGKDNIEPHDNKRRNSIRFEDEEEESIMPNDFCHYCCDELWHVTVCEEQNENPSQSVSFWNTTQHGKNLVVFNAHRIRNDENEKCVKDVNLSRMATLVYTHLNYILDAVDVHQVVL
jgi:hypothetical protein